MTMLFILETSGRVTAAKLADELEVSIRTIIRDLDELEYAGVPIRRVRGAGGGIEIDPGYRTTLPAPDTWQPTDRRPGRPRRAAVRISPEGRRLAAVLGRLQPLRVRRRVEPDEDGWVEATFRLETLSGAAHDILSLGPEVEVLAPDILRQRVSTQVGALARLYGR